MNVTIPRALSPATNPAGWLAAAGAVFAAAVMTYNAVSHHGVIDTGVIVAAVGAVGALLTRQVVTPVSDPKDGAGRPLLPVSPVTPPVPPYTVAPGTVPAATPAAPGVTGTVTA